MCLQCFISLACVADSAEKCTLTNLIIQEQMEHLVEGAIDVPGCGARQLLRGDTEGALDIVEVTAAHGL